MQVLFPVCQCGKGNGEKWEIEFMRICVILYRTQLFISCI
jgi:hypothetical protein